MMTKFNFMKIFKLAFLVIAYKATNILGTFKCQNLHYILILILYFKTEKNYLMILFDLFNYFIKG